VVPLLHVHCSGAHPVAPMFCPDGAVVQACAGPWFGLQPSGNPVEFRVMDLVRYRDGQWAEHWAVADAVSLLRQTGALG